MSVQTRSFPPSAASRNGTPGGLRSRWRRRSLTDAAYPLRVRALRIVYRTLAVGRDDSARRCRHSDFVQTCPFLHEIATDNKSPSQ